MLVPPTTVSSSLFLTFCLIVYARAVLYIQLVKITVFFIAWHCRSSAVDAVLQKQEERFHSFLSRNASLPYACCTHRRTYKVTELCVLQWVHEMTVIVCWIKPSRTIGQERVRGKALSRRARLETANNYIAADITCSVHHTRRIRNYVHSAGLCTCGRTRIACGFCRAFGELHARNNSIVINSMVTYCGWLFGSVRLSNVSTRRRCRGDSALRAYTKYL
jgi:hypothetical protein